MTPQFSELTQTLSASLGAWLQTGVQMLPNLVLAALVVLLGGVVARVAAALAERTLQRVSRNQQVNGLLTVTVRLVVIGVAVFAALAILRLDGVVTSMLAGVGVIGLALGFAFKDIAANLMSGVLMALSRPFQIGDLIRTEDFFGVVEDVDLRVTRLRTPTGELVLIPNQDVYNQAMVNYTETSTRRVDLSVGVGYDDDLVKAREVVRQALDSLPFAHDDKPTRVFYEGFGGSSIDMTAQVWLSMANQKNFMEARSDAIIAVKRALDANGLHIPFPIRTLDFGAAPVGGERLDTVLRPVFGEA